jgi:hypothetical protein
MGIHMPHPDLDGEAGEDRLRIIEIDVGLAVELADGRQRQLVGRERIVGRDRRREESLADHAMRLKRRRRDGRERQHRSTRGAL